MYIEHCLLFSLLLSSDHSCCASKKNLTYKDLINCQTLEICITLMFWSFKTWETMQDNAFMEHRNKIKSDCICHTCKLKHDFRQQLKIMSSKTLNLPQSENKNIKICLTLNSLGLSPSLILTGNS